MTKTQQIIAGLAVSFEKTAVSPEMAQRALALAGVDIMRSTPSANAAVAAVEQGLLTHPRTLMRAATPTPKGLNEMGAQAARNIVETGQIPPQVSASVRRMYRGGQERMSPEKWDALAEEISQKLRPPTKTAMHGYADYQMTDPISAPLPQMPLPSYELAEQEPPGSPAFPARAAITGGVLGAGVGGGIQQQNIMKELERLKFLRGQAEAGSPTVNMMLLDAVKRSGQAGGSVDLDALRKSLTSPQGVREYYDWATGGQGAETLAKQIPEHKGLLWKAIGKGPGLGLLGGTALGIGAGYALNSLFPEKTSAMRERGVLWKAAFRAGPPSPASYQIPDAWREFSQQRQAKVSPWGATMVAPSSQAATQVAHLSPSYERGASGVLKGVAAAVGRLKGRRI